MIYFQFFFSFLKRKAGIAPIWVCEPCCASGPLSIDVQLSSSLMHSLLAGAHIPRQRVWVVLVMGMEQHSAGSGAPWLSSPGRKQIPLPQHRGLGVCHHLGCPSIDLSQVAGLFEWLAGKCVGCALG